MARPCGPRATRCAAQCHMPAKFDAAGASSPSGRAATGAQCVNCHMATKTYMIVDERRDHSFRVPRPDLSVSIGTPNACTQCHRDRSADWAAQSVAGWFPDGRQTRPHYGTALYAGRTGGAGRGTAARCVDHGRGSAGHRPGDARCRCCRAIASPASAPAIAAAVADPDPLVRVGGATRAVAGVSARDAPGRFIVAARSGPGGPYRGGACVGRYGATGDVGRTAQRACRRQWRIGRRGVGRCRPAGGASQSGPAGHAAGAANRCGSGIPHRAASGSEFRSGADEPGRPGPDARHGCAGRGSVAKGTGDRAAKRRCHACPRAASGATAQLRRSAAAVAPGGGVGA